MKKIKFSKVTAFILLAVIVTSCFAGGTFAKYVTEGEGSDTARVAKWGVTVDVTGNGFAQTYVKDDGQKLPDNDTYSVRSTGSEEITFTWSLAGGGSSSTIEDVANLVAPGTSGEFGGISISGTPEVAVKVETTANVVFSGDWEVYEDRGSYYFYCPLKFTIGDKTINGLDYSGSNGTTKGGKDGFIRDIADAINSSDNYKRGTPLGSLGSNTTTYSWSWPFENATSDIGCDQDNTLDTELGTKATGENPPAVYITVTTTVTQIN